MKIEKINFTILCLTIISITALLTDNAGATIILWVGYGLYKYDK